MDKPLVTVVVPTKNSAEFLDECLRSIRAQTYPNLELIVVDNFSTDATQEIAERHCDRLLIQGPERSAQVNAAVAIANGDYVYKVDSDFVLEADVVQQCIGEVESGHDAVVVHNSPDPSIGWIARLRKFEVDMYKYDLTHSSARFVRTDVYRAIGGFDEQITAGEDYDFQNKLNRAGHSTGFVAAEALHRGEPKSLFRHLAKYYGYGKDFPRFREANRAESSAQLTFFRSAILRSWRTLLRHPMSSLALVAYSLAKYGAGGAGYVVGTIQQRKVAR